jgi:hypothetical protein
MTKTFLKAAAAASVLAASLVGTSAAHAASATAEARANIYKQVTVDWVADLDFATIVSDVAAADVSIDPTDGTLDCGGALVCTGTSARGEFEIAGSSGQTVDVSLTSSTITLTNPASDTMSLVLALSDTSLLLTGTPSSLYVGGTLSVGADQPDGLYTGELEVTADYQ